MTFEYPLCILCALSGYNQAYLTTKDTKEITKSTKDCHKL
jgi:hypothetical protein